jgi:protein O-mannosyl-transferase
MKLIEQHVNKVVFIFLFACVMLTYSNVYNFDFIYDDEFFIVKNQHLNSFSALGDIFTSSSTAGSGFKDSFYRPLQFTLYMFVKNTIGADAWGFHLLNILIHFLNSFLFYLLARKMNLSVIISTGIALLWSMHPIHVECVAYKSATADSLHTVLLLAGLHSVFPTSSWRGYVLAVIFFLLAILSKETAVLSAPLMTVCLFYFAKERWSWKTYLVTIPFWIMSLGYAVLRKTILNFDGDFNFYKVQNIYTESILTRTYTFFATLPKYLELLIWPHDLHIDRNFDVYTSLQSPLVFGGFLMCACAAIVLVLCLRSHGEKWLVPAFIVMWFATTHLLHSGVLLPLNSLFLEHWMYMPSMAFFLALGFILQYLWKKKFLHIPIVVCVLFVSLCLALFTHRQNRVWENAVSLFSHILKNNPKVARARHGLAMAYSDLGDNYQALRLYEEALAEKPYPQTYHNMALLYLKLNNFEKGEEFFLKAIAMDPQFFPAYVYIIQLYRHLGKVDKVNEYEIKLRTIRGVPQ